LIRMSASIKPLRRFSQNFLEDPVFARKLVEAMDVNAGDTLLEIGPGLGILTRCLIESPAGKIIGVELDRRCAERIRQLFNDERRFLLIEKDFLKIDFSALASGAEKIRIVGNIPYGITSPILFHLLDHRRLIRDFTITVQKEVGQRIAGSPGSKAYGIPSVLFQLHSDVRLLFDIPSGAFHPKPKVESSVLHGRFLDSPRYPVTDEGFFRTFVKTLFGQRRKMIRNTVKKWSLNRKDWGDMEKFLDRRPEALTVEQLIALSDHVFSRISRD
jgi:16S rRNA (adenine1518-N6/adenine1519-N6)-dimethyltransferase